jgi:MFS family permease
MKFSGTKTSPSQTMSLETKDDASHVEDSSRSDAVFSGTTATEQPDDGLGHSSEEKALVRKLDYHIMPIMWAMYFLNYLDRNAIAQARLSGLEDDLRLHGSQFNVCVSILFVGYTLVQLPSNMLMSTNRVRPSLWMCVWMLSWAVISACTALARSYQGLIAIRFLLGIAEAPLYSGAIYLLSIFYPRREIATRIGILYSANICATSFSGLIAAATFATLEGVHGIRGWQWLFIIEGVLTFATAFIAIFMLPDHPLMTRWLTQRERELAQGRMDEDTVGLEPSKGLIQGLKQAVMDPKMWLLVVMQTLHLSACGFNSFFPTVVSALGFNETITLVLTCPPYLISGVFAVLWGMSSGKLNERTWHITIAMSIAIVGFVISCITLNIGARYTSCFLFCIGAYAPNSIILGWVSATCGQTSEKKAASLSIVNMFANASFIYTPYLYPASDNPKYVTAMTANASFSFCTILCALVLRAWLKAENEKILKKNPNHRVFYAY